MERQGVGASRARYVEIADYLRACVAAAGGGSRLPSESELCRRFGVSRMTVRQAVQQLAADGLIYRSRGRGTFVADHPVPRLLGSPLSFSESMSRRGGQTSSRLLEGSVEKASPEDSEALELPAGGSVVVVERLRLSDDIPMAIERAILEPRLAGVLENDLEGGSLHAVMESMGRIPTLAQARVSARAAGPAERGLLELERDDDVLLCERRVIRDQDGVPLEHTETRYAARRYVFEVVLQRDYDYAPGN